MSSRNDPAPVAISIVVPSHNRATSLLRLLRSLQAHRGTDRVIGTTPFEVIVVADGCSDGTGALLQDTITAGEWSFPLTIIEHVTPLGSGVARDAGAAAARGSTLLFIDDDIEPFPTMLAEHAAQHTAAHHAGYQLVLIGAPVPVRGPQASLEHVEAWGWWERQFERMSERGHRFTHDEIFTGILSVSTAVFHDIGGFDTALTHCHEDLELGLRLFRAGARAGFTRLGGGVHHEVRGIRRLLPRKDAEGRADVRLLQRWPELVQVSPLARYWSPNWSIFQLVRAAAFVSGTTFSALVDALGLSLLVMFERLKARRTWRALQGALLFFRYWRGAALQAGSKRALTQLLADGDAAVERWQAECRHLSLDLVHGLDAAERLLDERRPDALTVSMGDVLVGTVIAPVNAERLHGGHLRRILATTLSHALRAAVAVPPQSDAATTCEAGTMHAGVRDNRVAHTTSS